MLLQGCMHSVAIHYMYMYLYYRSVLQQPKLVASGLAAGAPCMYHLLGPHHYNTHQLKANIYAIVGQNMFNYYFQ